MMVRLPLYGAVPFRYTDKLSFGLIVGDNDGGNAERLYAFALADRARPQVFEFTTDDDGLQSLSNLIRCEEVVSVVRGHNVPFEVASVVEVNMRNRRHQDRLVLPRNY